MSNAQHPIIQLESEHLVQSYKRPPFVLTRGEGMTVYDDQGRAYLDWVAGIAVNAFGYGDAGLAEAIQKASTGLLHTSNLYYTAHLTAYLPVREVEPLDRGISVARKYSLLSDPDAAPITEAPVGEPVQVTLTIIAPNDLHYVVVEDPIPAGSDAVNPELETTSRVGTQPELERERPLSEGWGWWWFSNIEMRDEKVVLYATYLPRGTYQFNYVIQPGLAGEYNVIPATAQEFYFPDVYGRSAGSIFTITEAAE